MHAERCPVCTGHGALQTSIAPQVCHGCTGRGWIAVLDVQDSITLRNEAIGAGELRVPVERSHGVDTPAAKPTRVVFSQELIERILRDGKLERYTEADGTMVVTGIGWGNIYIGAKS